MHPSPEDDERSFEDCLPELGRWRRACENAEQDRARRTRDGIGAIDPHNHDILIQSFRQIAEHYGTSVRERPSFEHLLGTPPNRAVVPLNQRFSPVVVEAACSRDRALWSFLVAGGVDHSFAVDVQASRYLPTIPHSKILDTNALPLVRTAVAIGIERHELFRSAAYTFVACERTLRFHGNSPSLHAAKEVMLSPEAFREAEAHLAIAASNITQQIAAAGRTPPPLGVQHVSSSILLWHALQVVACDIGPTSQIVGIHRLELLPDHTLKLEVAAHNPAFGSVILPSDESLAEQKVHAVEPSTVLSFTRLIRVGTRAPSSFAFAERVA